MKKAKPLPGSAAYASEHAKGVMQAFRALWALEAYAKEKAVKITNK